MNRFMAVYDSEPCYAQRFAEYANQKERIPFPVISFSSTDRLIHYLSGQKAEILLIGECEPAVIDDCRTYVRQLLILHNGAGDDTTEVAKGIYKYQSADGILREVMALYEKAAGEFSSVGKGAAATVTGIFSPVNRCQKTAFSLTYAQTLAEERRTLYMSLEDCSGFARLIPRDSGGDLSDALYFFKQQALDRLKLGAVTYSLGELDYIPPVRYPEDLYETSAEELARLLQQIGAAAGYHNLVVDMGSLGRAAARILEVCDVIFMPVLEDQVSAAKIGEFEDYLKISRRSYITERIQKLTLPVAKPGSAAISWPEQLLWGEMGDYVRQLVKGGGSSWYH